jgi:hypothetical protein
MPIVVSVTLFVVAAIGLAAAAVQAWSGVTSSGGEPAPRPRRDARGRARRDLRGARGLRRAHGLSLRLGGSPSRACVGTVTFS